MYRMNNLVEILLGILLILLVVGEPKFLVRFTKSGLGKLAFLAALIFSSLKSLTAGVLVFLIYVALRRDFTLVEGMENEDSSNSESDNESDSENDNESDNESDSEEKEESVNINVKEGVNMSKSDFMNKYCKNGKVDSSMTPPPLKYTNGKCNPCDEDCGFEVTSATEQLTIDEAMRPKESNSIPVSKN